MTPQAIAFLEKARKLLTDAEMMVSVGLHDAAGRTAYLASFHVAQTYIFERLGKVLKTHGGVQSEFGRPTKHDKRVDPDLRRFLSQSYELKSAADYLTGPGSSVEAETAMEAVNTAKKFILHFTGLITAPS